MNIRWSVGLAILLSSLIAIAGTLYLGNRYLTVSNQLLLRTSEQGVLRTVDRLELQIGQWLTLTDLIIASDETFLLQGAEQQSMDVLSSLEELIASPLSLSTRANWERCVYEVESIGTVLRSYSEVILDPAQERAFLSEYDAYCMELVANLEGGASEIREVASRLIADLREELERVERMALLLTLVYIILTLLIWRISVHRIVVPLEQLTSEAERSRLEATPFNLEITKAPLEVIELEESFGRLTQDLTNRQTELQLSMEALETAKKKLDTAYEAKSAFLSQMSHELRTPLNAILGYSSIVAEELRECGDQFEVQVHDLGKVHHSGEHLLCLINDILDFSKYESGKLALNYSDVELYPELHAIAESVDVLAEANGNRVEVVSSPDIGTAEIDRTRCRQILINLLSNACKFTKEGCVTLSLDSYFNDDEIEWLRYQVKDTGIGMTPEQQEKVFAPFMQASSETSVKYGGTGLGLSICLALVEQMQGEISVSSVHGEGTTFTVEIPRRRAEESSPESSSHTAEISG